MSERTTYTTLISVAELSAHLDDPGWAIVDCRFSLADFEKGRREYPLGHIPGAVYCHLDEDLCSPIIPGVTGRHPLPTPEYAADRLSRLGIGPGVQVVAYDDWPGAPGAIAVRLWWTLRWLGHRAAAVLDGGLQAWRGAGLPERTGIESRPPAVFTPHERPSVYVSSAEVERLRADPAWKLLDARAADRYRGENETIDPVAGHIPGAGLAPYMENYAPDGRLLPVEALRQRWQGLLGATPPEHTAFYCGSGVTSIVNLLALEHAGLGEARLYAGSWSEWIAPRTRPVAAGEPV